MTKLSFFKNNCPIIRNIILSCVYTYSMRLFLVAGPAFIWVILFSLLYFFVSTHKPVKISKSILSASLIIGALYAIMIYLSHQLQLNGEIFFDPHALLCMLALSCLLSHMLYCIFAFHLERASTGIRRSGILQHIFPLTLIILLFWSPYLVACFPGNLTSDSIGEIRQQLGLSPLSNQHTVIHQLMIKACLNAGQLFGTVKTGVAIYTVLQMIITAVIFACSIVFMEKKNVNKIYKIGVLLFYSLYTTNGFYSVTMYKDVPFAATTLLLMILLIKELHGDYRSRELFIRVLSIIAIILVSFLFCTVRNNGYYAFIIGFIPIILLNLKDSKRLLIIFFVTFLLVNSYYYVLFDVVGAKKSSSGEILGLPLQMLARVVKEDSPDLTTEDFETLQEIIPDYELLAQKYTSNNSDPIKGPDVFLAEKFDQNPSRYLNSWIRVGLLYPRTYLNAFLLHTQSVWDPNCEHSSISAYIYENEFGITHSDSVEPLRIYLIETHQRLATNSLLSPFYSIGFMVMLFLFSFSMLVLKRQISTASPIFILATLWATAAAAPLCLYQYVYGLTVTIPLFLVLALSLPNRRKI